MRGWLLPLIFSSAIGFDWLFSDWADFFSIENILFLVDLFFSILSEQEKVRKARSKV